MERRTEIVKGKTKIIITRKASGVDKVKEAVCMVMGPGWEYENYVKNTFNK